MLTTAEIQAVLGDITYRPGWTFTLQEGQPEGPHLFIVGPVVNSYQPHDTIDLGIRSPLPPFRTVDDLLLWLAWRLRRIEDHESREWFRYRGEVVDDPHAEPSHPLLIP